MNLRSHPLHPHQSPLFRTLFATLLVALSGCNSTRDDANRQRRPATVPTGAATQPLAMLTRAEQRDAEEMRKAVAYLASDELEGRGVETDGIHKAADYIARRFKSAGLKPLPGVGGYLQPFTVSLNTVVGDATSLRLGQRALARDKDFLPMSLSGEGTFDAPVAFVGYAIHAPDHNYDDFAGVDLSGKVALALRYEPTDKQNKSPFSPDGRSEHSALTTKAKAAAERGAAALLIVNPPSESQEDLLQPLRRARGNEKASIPVIQITRAVANEILKSGGGGKDLEALQKQINEGPTPQPFVLDGARASGRVQMQRNQREVSNVLAYVPGKGPLKDEYVVVGAHYDHLGWGEAGSLLGTGEKAIHNGADDNASGTAAVLQMAKHVAKRPRERSVVFVAFAGEERGLLGSVHFVNHPPVPLDKIVAMLNLDMVGRVDGEKLGVGGTGTAAQFDAIIAAVDEQSPLRLEPAAARVGGRGGVGPSDHASFAAKKIPVLFFWSGNHIDYHRPTDDPEKINYAGMAHVVDAGLELIDHLARMPRTQYVDKFDSTSMSMGTMRVRLGIMPEYADEGDGVKVGTALPNSAAAKAGIREGDVIVQIGDDTITSLTDYMSSLNKYNPGDTVKIGVLRNGERIDVDATFTGRRG